MKKSIKTILAGLLVVPVIALGISLFSPVSQPVLAQTVTGGAAGGALSVKDDTQSTNLFGDQGIFKIIVNVALYIIGAVSVLMLIYGGIRYTVSGGESAAVTSAKNTILYAIIGIIIALLAYAIVNFVLGNLISA
jgi:hypothetical protein